MAFIMRLYLIASGKKIADLNLPVCNEWGP